MVLSRQILFINIIFALLFLSGCSLSADLSRILHGDAAPVLNIQNKTPAIIANATNISAVSITGTCTETSGNVTIKVAQLYTKSISCSHDQWSDSLDLTSLADNDSYQLTAVQSNSSGVSATDSAVLMIDTVLPQVTGISDSLLPGPSLASGWSCVDALDSCKFRYMVTNNPAFTFTTELLDTTNSLLLLSAGQAYIYVQAIDKAKNLSPILRVNTYVGEPKIFIGGLQRSETTTGVEDLNILAASSLTEMALFNNALCTGVPSWIPSANLVSAWTLDPAAAGGTAAVSVKFRTADGQVSSCYSDTILWPHPTVYRMCTATTSNTSTGILEDSGGPSANYSDNEDCTLALTLPGSTTFTFESIDVEDGWDFVKITDGGTQVLNYTGSGPLADITTTSTNVQINFTSDSSYNQTGFKISWKAAGAAASADALSLNLNSGDAVTFSPTVAASLTYDSIFKEVYLTENSSCSAGGAWTAVAAQLPWTFSNATDGAKTLYVKFRDVFGNESFCESDTITLTTPQITLSSPANGASVKSTLVLAGTCSAAGNNIDITGSVTATTTCAVDGSWGTSLDISSIANGASVAITANLKSGTAIAASASATYTVNRTLAITSPVAASYVGPTFTISGTCNTNGTTITSSSPSVATTTCAAGAWTLNLTATGSDGATVNASVSMMIGAVTQETKTRSFVLSTAAPTAVITGAPTGSSIATSVTVGVGGTNVDKYKYKFGSAIDCTDATGYSAEIAVATSTTLNQSAVANGTVNLCVIGRSAINGLWQSAAAATVATWTKDSNVSVNITTAHQIVTEGATGLQFTATLSGTKTTDTRVYYSYYGNTIYMVDHNLAQGYITIPAGALSASITYDTFGNSLLDGDRELRIYLTHTNNAAVNLGTDVITSVYIKDDDQIYKSIIKTAMSQENVCAIYSDNKLRCWGSNSEGQLGTGDTNYTPGVVEPYPAERFLEISMSRTWACAITTTKKLFCWGQNYSGQLGTGDTTAHLVPTAIDAAENYLKVDAQYADATCALTDAGKIKCWGDNSYGELGLGNTTNQHSPTAVDSTETYSSLVHSAFGDCGITTTGVLKCWGDNSLNQITTTSTTAQLLPVVVDSGTNYSSFSGNASFCGVTTAGVLKCWGYNANGEVPGVVGSPATSRATVIDAGTTYKQVSVTANYACAITSSDDLKCWGTVPGIFSVSQSSLISTPTLVPGNFKFSSILLGSSYGACGISTAGDLICMGDYINQVFESRYNMDMFDIDPFETIVTYSVGDATTCAINSAGTASCFGTYSGSGSYRQTRVIAERGASYAGGTVSATAKGACIIDAAGAMKCAGVNVGGAVGDGTSTNQTTFTSVAPSVAFANTARDDYYCAAAISTTGKLYGWSSCGSGSTIPVALDTATTYQNILGVAGHACALTTSNDLKCWGTDGFGALGGSDKATPTLMDSGTKYKTFVVADSFTCGITTGDKLRCWGRGSTGRLGNGATSNATSPVAVDSGSNYSKVAVGINSICGITSTGALNCWGYVGYWAANTTYTTPQLVNSGTSYQDVAVSADSIMAVTAAGQLHYWPLGRFDQSLQILVPGKSFKSIKSYFSGNNFCALSTDDHVYCNNGFWGAGQVSKPKAMPFTRWLQ